jgi:multiple sugar transport system permease protein
MRSKNLSPRTTVAIFLLPSLLGFLVFVAAPIAMAAGMSFTNFSGGPKFRFVGLRNYAAAFGSPQFAASLGVTALFTVWTVALQLVLGLAFALLLDAKFIGRDFLRGLVFLPNVLSSVAVGLAFCLVLDPKRGPVNQFIAHLGLRPPNWLAGEDSALGTLVMVGVWQSFGYYMVLFLAGLQTINPSLYEAASIDGARAVRRFLSVTLPGLSPIAFYSLTIAIIRAFQVFDQVYVMTGGQAGGGPAGSTTVLVFDIYRNGFGAYRFGYAAAESVLLLAVVLLVTLAQDRAQRKWVSYDLA